jgi:hypothetical protein
MADSSSFNQPASPTVKVVAKRKARRETSRVGWAGNFTIWAGLVAGGIAALIPMTNFVREEIETWSLVHADDATVAQALERDWPHATSADQLEALSERSLHLPTPDLGSAYAAAQRATAIDPSRAFAWANLAWLETTRASGKVNQASLDALVKSMDACPLCSEELIRWRFNFVLANWTAMPEGVRRRAFEQADLLRWVGPNAEFLAEMRAKARASGIPFDAYRAAVNTPVRTFDIGPAPQPRTTRIASAS